MADIPPPVDTHVPRGPQSSLVAVLAFLLLLAFCVVAYLFLHHTAPKVLPPAPQNHAGAVVL